MATHDWEAIKKDYVEGIQKEDGTMQWPTLDALVTEHKVSRSTLSKRTAQEDWTTQRNMFRTKVETKRQEKKSEYLASKAAQFDIDVFRVVEAGLKHVQGHFLKAQALLIKSEGLDPMPTSTLNSLTVAVERLQRIGRLSLGEPLEIPGISSGNNYYLIQEIINDNSCIERIRANYRSRTGGRVSKE